MAKWQVMYTRTDGATGHFKVTASSKIEATEKARERALKGAPQLTGITRIDCRLAQA